MEAALNELYNSYQLCEYRAFCCYAQPQPNYFVHSIRRAFLSKLSSVKKGES